MTNPVVSSQWLFENLNNLNLIVLDASQKAITSDKTVENNLQIPGARHFDLKNNFRDSSSDLPNMLPSAVQFELEAQKLGVNSSSIIVVYDNLGIYSSPRVWWMFKIMRHKNVFVLNGGLPDWLKNNYPTEEKQPQQYELGNFKTQFNSANVKDYDFIKAKLNNEKNIVIDARSTGRFNGTAPEPREGLRSGHIPNSFNIPFGDVLENGKYKSKEKLAKVFSKINPENKELIYSCGSGLTACIILLAGELVLPNTTSVYDGSWTEWGQKE
ncbi:MAG: sulfurtransferase [Flavobacteriales bacterium]|nr:MAG: sulfurtransferase [Flavobacteriales bacterium]